MQTKRQLKWCTRNAHPSSVNFRPRLWCKFSYFTNSKLSLGVKFIFIISLMHTLSDKVRFVQKKLKPEEAFTTKKWMVLAKHLLAQAHICITAQDSQALKNTQYIIQYINISIYIYIYVTYILCSIATVAHGPFTLPTLWHRCCTGAASSSTVLPLCPR